MAAGGAAAVAVKIGSTRSHLGNVIGGARGLGRKTAERLRRVIKLDAKSWVALLAVVEEPARQRRARGARRGECSEVSP